MILLIAAAALTAAPSPAPSRASGTAVDADRAFARDAQRIGQWSAFAKYADHDAVMFVPKAVWARDYLNGRRNPRRAMIWSPARSITSCDGKVAVNEGPWRIPGARVQGRFTTVWQQKSSGWRWIYDGGQPTPAAASIGTSVQVTRASCGGRPTGAPIIAAPKLDKGTGPTPIDVGRGESGDRTLGWDWKVEASGARHFRVFQWTGARYVIALDQHIAK